MKRDFLPTSWKMPLNRYLVYLILLTAGAFLIFWISEEYNHRGSKQSKRLHWSEKSNLKDKNNNFALSHEHLFPKKIFLVETSGSRNLNLRQACAVESAAHHHPDSEIQVLKFPSEPHVDTFGLSRLFSNIHIKSAKLDSIFINTTLWNWYQKADWKTSPYRAVELSDAVRILLVWKYGGLYLDLDTVTLRTLYGKRNFLIRQFTESICNCVFSFESHHPFLSKCLELLPVMYKKGVWGCVGPILFGKVFESLCQSSILEGTFPRCNLMLLPTEKAFPVHWKNWQDYFSESKTEDLLIKMKGCYLIHVWNSQSKEKRLPINSGTLYEKTVKENCPAVYNYIKHFR